MTGFTDIKRKKNESVTKNDTYIKKMQQLKKRNGKNEHHDLPITKSEAARANLRVSLAITKQ